MKFPAFVGIVTAALLSLLVRFAPLNSFFKVAGAGFLTAFLATVIVQAALMRRHRGRGRWTRRPM